MNDHWLSSFFQLLIFIPGIILCYLPAYTVAKFKLLTLTSLWTILLTLYVLIGSTLQAYFSVPMYLIELPALVVFFLIYWSTVHLDIIRALAIFVTVCSIEMFSLQIACFIDAFWHPTLGIAQLSWQAALIEALFSFVLLGALFYPAKRYFSWMIHSLDSPKIWGSIIMISAIFFGLSLFILPLSYQTVHQGRIRLIYPTVGLGAILVLSSIYIIYYYTTVLILKNYELREKASLLEIQTKHTQVLQNYIRQNAKLRHDFRHSVRLISSLIDEGDLMALKKHLSIYEKQLSTSSPTHYCNNTALNALLSYYQEMAKEAHVKTIWSISLPDPLPFSELDLATLFGNLIENAIKSCQQIPEDQRYFHLTTEVSEPGHLYIVSTNSFNGHVRFKNGKYYSTHTKGLGIGLPSIQATAEKYKGEVKISHSPNEFYVDILLKF